MAKTHMPPPKPSPQPPGAYPRPQPRPLAPRRGLLASGPSGWVVLAAFVSLPLVLAVVAAYTSRACVW